jgi:chromate transporter
LTLLYCSCSPTNRNFAYGYKEYGQLPQLQPFLYGIKPAIIAVILELFILWQKSLKTVLGIIAGFAIVTITNQ